MSDSRIRRNGNGPVPGDGPAREDGLPRRQWLRLNAGAFGLLAAGRLQAQVGQAWSTGSPVASVERIGLLLPRSSGAFGRASAAVRAGIETGFRRDSRGLAVDIYEVDENARSLASAYRGMLDRGTSLVLGPLTRAATNALLDLGEIPITTVAMNQIDGDGALPWNVLVFTLAVEQEAIQVADIAFQQLQATLPPGRRPRATIVTATTVIGKRAAGTFHERWRSLGGEAQLPIELEESALYKFRTVAKAANQDVWFLSMAPQLARPVRIIIGRSLPVYGTSQLSTGNPATAAPAPELDGVRLVEMPALVQAQIYDGLGYPAPPADFTLEMQRLYAMGIDAFRVARAIFAQRGGFDIDGLTGRLRYDGQQPRITRLASLAEYRSGVPGAI